MEGLGPINEDGFMQSRAEVSGGQFSGEHTPMLKLVMEFEKREAINIISISISHVIHKD